MKMFKSRARVTWVVSILSIVILLLLFMSGFLTWAINQFGKEVTAQSAYISTVIQTNIDDRLSEIEQFSSQIEISQTNIGLSKATNLSDQIVRAEYALYSQLSNYTLTNRIVDRAYIYYPNLDVVIGDQGYFSSRNYYLLDNDLSDIGYEQWVANLKNLKVKGYYFSGGALVFSKQLPYNELAKNTAVIIIQINQSEIATLLQGSEVGVQTYSAIVSEDGSPYAVSLEQSRDDIISVTMQGNRDAPFSWGGYACAFKQSLYANLGYLVLVQQKNIMAPVYNLRNYSIVLIVFLLSVGVAFAVVAGYRNSRPLESLTAKYSKEQTLPNSYVDEYHLLEALLDQGQKSHVQASKQQQFVEQLFLNNLIANHQRSSQLIFGLMQKMDIEFLYPQFQVVIVRPMLPVNSYESTPNWDGFRGALGKNALIGTFIASTYKENFIILLNFDTGETQTKFVSVLSAIYRCAADYGRMLIAVGERYDDLAGIIESYDEACEVAEANHDGGSGVYYFDRATMKDNSATYSNEMISDFKKKLTAREYAQADKMFDMLIGNIHSAHNRDIAKIQSDTITYELLCAVTEAAKHDKTIRINEIAHALVSADTVEKSSEAVHQVLQNLTNRDSQNGLQRGKAIAMQAVSIIDADYTNPMLGLYSISEQLGVSNSYLSSAVKEYKGVGIAQYINKLRIEKAKQLLAKTNVSVKDIALQVGFSSDMSFIRVFKQFENTTPGKYREKS